jgi:hypothetical protein
MIFLSILHITRRIGFFNTIDIIREMINGLEFPSKADLLIAIYPVIQYHHSCNSMVSILSQLSFHSDSQKIVHNKSL